MPLLTDMWRCAIARAPVEKLITGGLSGVDLIWLPKMRPFTFRADPFGMWQGDQLYIYAEGYDYRDRIGRIDLLVYDKELRFLTSQVVLKEPWHLSYPFLFEVNGDVWMLPEAFRSGTLTLYRARHFPGDWEPVCEIPLDGPAIDATPVYYHGKWWLFYSPSTSKEAKISHLHVAFADQLEGPWKLHPLNPIRVDRASARPGGRPVVMDDRIILPVQDCRNTYGGAIRWLEIDRLDEKSFQARDRSGLMPIPDMAPYIDGLHSVSGCGPVTLIDAKKIVASLHGLTIHARHWLGKAVR